MRRYPILFSVIVLALGACEAPGTLAPDRDPNLLRGGIPNAPVQVEWTKTETGPGTGQWRGTNEFGLPITTAALSLRVTGVIWHLETFWSVDLGSRSFDATLMGTLNTGTGRLVLSGPAVSGVFAGSQVSVEGQLTGVDPVAGGTVFEGTLRIMNPFSG